MNPIKRQNVETSKRRNGRASHAKCSSVLFSQTLARYDGIEQARIRPMRAAVRAESRQQDDL